MGDLQKRVRLYELDVDKQWDDKGTGQISLSSDDENPDEVTFILKSETDGSILLELRIQKDATYLKQQDTLIVFKEGDKDLALSFQEKVGCDEVWELICKVQGKDPSVDIPQVDIPQDIAEESEEEEKFEDLSDIDLSIELPPCEFAKVDELNEFICNSLASPMRTERVASAIVKEEYIPQLLEMFHIWEDLDNIDGLHQLYEIFRNLIFFNKVNLLEILFAPDVILDVVGVLEYQPTAPAPRRHRDYLKSVSKYKEVIPFSNEELVAKIHQTYRVQYIQDVVLPPPAFFEEGALSTLNSFVFFNKVDIIRTIQDDHHFLSELFALLKGASTPESKVRDLLLFLKELCVFSQMLQPQTKIDFYKTLSNLGVLQALGRTLKLEDVAIKTATVDVLTFIVNFSPPMIREYALNQVGVEEDDQLLINIIVRQLACDRDPELGSTLQLGGILKCLLDTDDVIPTANKSEMMDFLNFFYKHSIPLLIAPVLRHTSEDGLKKEDDATTAQLLGPILDLLTFCVMNHTYLIRNLIVSKDLLRKILVLLKSKHTFLVLAALRFMRKIVGLKDDAYNRYLVNGNMFGPVLDTFERNKGTYNLLDSALIEMFEFIKEEDIKALWLHVMEKYGKVLDSVDYVKTFRTLRVSYEEHLDLPQTKLTERSPLLSDHRFRRDPRQMDEDEEAWFNEDEEEEEEDSETLSDDIADEKLDDDSDSSEKVSDKQDDSSENEDNLKEDAVNHSLSTAVSSESIPSAPTSPNTKKVAFVPDEIDDLPPIPPSPKRPRLNS